MPRKHLLIVQVEPLMARFLPPTSSTGQNIAFGSQNIAPLSPNMVLDSRGMALDNRNGAPGGRDMALDSQSVAPQRQNKDDGAAIKTLIARTSLLMVRVLPLTVEISP